MGIFDFFRKSTSRQNDSSKLTSSNLNKKEVEDLVLSSLNILCDDVSTVEDVIKMLKLQGHDDRQSLIIAERAERLYQKHFANRQSERNTVPGKTLNEIYAEKRAENNGTLSFNEVPDGKFNSTQFQIEITAMARTEYFENDQNMEVVKQILLNRGLSNRQADTVLENLSNLNEKLAKEMEQGLSSGNIIAEFTPNPAHTRDNVDQEQIDRYIGYGAFQLEHKNCDNAMELFNKAIELGDKTGLAHANLGAVHHELNNYQQSVENYDEAIKLNPGIAGFYCSKGLALEVLGDKIGAKQSYEKAIQLDASYTIALNNLGVLQIGDENYQEALDCFNKLLAVEPADADAIVNKLSILVELDLRDALAFYISIPDVIDLYEVERIIVNALLTKYTEVESISWLEVLYRSSKESKYIRLQSLVLYGANKLGSFELINTYLRSNPSDQSAIDLKLDLAFQLMETIGEPRFIESVDECLALDDKNPTALNYKIQILLKQQKLAEALDRVDDLFMTYYKEQKVLHLFTQVYNQLDKEIAMLRFEKFAKQLDVNANYQLGYMKGLYLKGKRYHDEAILAFTVLNEERKFSWNYYQIAIIENTKGNTERCLLNLKKTFELEPELKEDAKNYIELQNLAADANFQSLLR
jgi:tetratricopeptide (TPR) repeat protein